LGIFTRRIPHKVETLCHNLCDGVHGTLLIGIVAVADPTLHGKERAFAPPLLCKGGLLPKGYNAMPLGLLLVRASGSCPGGARAAGARGVEGPPAEVLEPINEIFSQIMSKEAVDISYDVHAHLNPGLVFAEPTKGTSLAGPLEINLLRADY